MEYLKIDSQQKNDMQQYVNNAIDDLGRIVRDAILLSSDARYKGLAQRTTQLVTLLMPIISQLEQLQRGIMDIDKSEAELQQQEQYRLLQNTHRSAP